MAEDNDDVLIELVGFLKNDIPQVRQKAAENLIGFSQLKPDLFKRNDYDPVKDLKKLVDDVRPISTHALDMLVNLTGEDDVVPLLADDEPFLEKLMSRIIRKNEQDADLIAMIFANLAGPGARSLVKLLTYKPKKHKDCTLNSTTGMDLLVELFVDGADHAYNKSAHFDHLAYVFSDMAIVDEIQLYFMTAQKQDPDQEGTEDKDKDTPKMKDKKDTKKTETKDKSETKKEVADPDKTDDKDKIEEKSDSATTAEKAKKDENDSDDDENADYIMPLAKLMVFTEHPSHIRRQGVANTIKNCAFDIAAQHIMTAPADESTGSVNVLPHILRPIMGPEEYPDYETELMLPSCQDLGPDKKREPDVEICRTHVETLLMLVTTLEGRHRIRSVNVYPIIRNLHLYCEDEDVREVCDQFVQVTMRGEEGYEMAAPMPFLGGEKARLGQESDEDDDVVEVA